MKILPYIFFLVGIILIVIGLKNILFIPDDISLTSNFTEIGLYFIGLIFPGIFLILSAAGLKNKLDGYK